MKRLARISLAALLAATALAGCRDAESMEIEPLPPLERPSPEARAGLPEVVGQWRFAGFEIAERDTAAVADGTRPLTAPGDLVLQVQRLDSIAGRYAAGEQAFPFVGEIRRDSAFSVVVAEGEGARRIVAGRVLRDTLWIELTTLGVGDAWPRHARAALVRGTPGEPFVRLLGGAPLYTEVPDTLPADTLPPGVMPPEAMQPGVERPEGEPQRPPTEVRPAEPRPTPPAERPAPPPQQPRPTPPVERPAPPPAQPAPPPPAEPAPPPAEEPAPPPPAEPAPPRVDPTPQLPGRPVPRDTIRLP